MKDVKDIAAATVHLWYDGRWGRGWCVGGEFTRPDVCHDRWHFV